MFILRNVLFVLCLTMAGMILTTESGCGHSVSPTERAMDSSIRYLNSSVTGLKDVYAYDTMWIDPLTYEATTRSHQVKDSIELIDYMVALDFNTSDRLQKLIVEVAQSGDTSRQHYLEEEFRKTQADIVNAGELKKQLIHKYSADSSTFGTPAYYYVRFSGKPPEHNLLILLLDTTDFRVRYEQKFDGTFTRIEDLPQYD